MQSRLVTETRQRQDGQTLVCFSSAWDLQKCPRSGIHGCFTNPSQVSFQNKNNSISSFLKTHLRILLLRWEGAHRADVWRSEDSFVKLGPLPPPSLGSPDSTQVIKVTQQVLNLLSHHGSQEEQRVCVRACVRVSQQPQKLVTSSCSSPSQSLNAYLSELLGDASFYVWPQCFLSRSLKESPSVMDLAPCTHKTRHPHRPTTLSFLHLSSSDTARLPGAAQSLFVK